MLQEEEIVWSATEGASENDHCIWKQGSYVYLGKRNLGGIVETGMWFEEVYEKMRSESKDRKTKLAFAKSCSKEQQRDGNTFWRGSFGGAQEKVLRFWNLFVC